ncbi:MAG: hypothetical protein GX962_14645, partial [Epulopiscium sp.]|nr:hypothetical protein [Candidatus Epulonipiscium sp.]
MQTNNKQLIATFSQQGFSLELEPVRASKVTQKNKELLDLYNKHGQDREKFAFYLGFLEFDSNLAPSLLYLNTISKSFLKH